MSEELTGGLIADARALGKGAPAGIALSNAVASKPGANTYYTKGVVVEYISNPAAYLSRVFRDTLTNEEKSVRDSMIPSSSEDFSEKEVQNHRISRYMPPNSIVAYIDKNRSNEKPVIVYPFFPPHISLPLKPGEQVWILVESKGDNNDFYYWMSRVATDRQIDDLNYTNMDRTDAIRALSDAYDEEGSNVTDDGLLSAAVTAEIFDNPRIPNGLSVSQIHAASVAYRSEFISEPVPRVLGKASDLSLQGSNNAVIQLTTEKFRKSEDIVSREFLGSEGSENGLSTHTPRSGTIDMFVGHEKNRLEELSKLSDPEEAASAGMLNVRLNKRLVGNQSFETYETSKIDEFALGSENELEGDDSARNVHSRLYLGMNAAPDESFEFANLDFSSKNEFNVDHAAVGSSAVLYSNHIRSYAEDSLRLHVYPPDPTRDSVSVPERPGGAVIDMSSDGTITLQSGEGEEASKIILRSNGNIVIKPGKTGILYLGGDETETAGVAVSATNISTPLNGQTVASVPAVQTTMGGQAFLGDALSGNTSSKVLIKV